MATRKEAVELIIRAKDETAPTVDATTIGADYFL